jgi:hypothetical protein
MSKVAPVNKLTRKQMLQNTFDLLAEQMDRRDEFFFKLRDFHEQYGHIPKEYVGPWIVWCEQDKQKPWREIPLCAARLWKTARIQVRNGYEKAQAALSAHNVNSITK